ncbi:MAG: DUF4886 domain-containing protein [Bacteroidaceae bacterium]|nr:DUF4886 domain-containing protein [Bacteroidaceae bacterium]
MRLKLLSAVLCLFATATFAAEPLRVRVLSIGNSFSRDAFAYVPFLIEEFVPDAEVDFGILYIGGCSLERHYNNLVGEKPDYEFDYYKAGAGKWSIEKGVTLQQGVEREDWDIIILQQQSGRSRYFDTYQPYLNDLLEYLSQAKPRATTAWLMTQAYGTGYKNLDGMTSDEMWARVNASSQRAFEETSIKLLIPAGTAIQNARYTSLDRLGKAGHLVNDGFHLQEGIPALIEGLVTTQVILKHFGVDVDVEKSRLKITPEWREERRTPQPHGEPEEATDEEYILARRSAKWALESPWQLRVVEE